MLKLSNASKDEEPEAASQISHNQLFQTARGSRYEDVPILACEDADIEWHDQTQAEVGIAVHDGDHVEFKTRHIPNCCINDGDYIAREVKSTLKKKTSSELYSTIQE